MLKIFATRQRPGCNRALASFFQDLHQAACPCMIAAISLCSAAVSAAGPSFC
jgi:hypothetical protein